MKILTSKRLRGGLLAAAVLVGGGGGALALGATPAGASNKQITAVGSFTIYQLDHAMFPTSLNDLLPGGKTPNQKIATTPTYCSGGVTYTMSSKGAPNGSKAGKIALADQERAATFDKKGCITFARSSSTPSKQTTTTATIDTTHFVYYAMALDGVWFMVGIDANKTAAKVSSTTPNTPRFKATAELTLTKIRKIYKCTIKNWKTVNGGRVTATINRFWPQTGSGTRNFGTNMLGFTPSKTKGTCTTAAITHFTGVTTPTGVENTVPNEENTESGLVYATKHMSDTIKADIFIYSAGKFVSQWNNTTTYGTTQHNRINNKATGNFTPKQVELASSHERTATGTTTTVGAQERYVKFATTAAGRTTKKASITTTTVTETNEWYHQIATNSDPAKTSKTQVVGVRYVYNICDTALPSYNGCTLMVGFDNQTQSATAVLPLPTVQTTGQGTKSRLCAGDYKTVIMKQGFVPLSKTTGPVATSNKAGATCRQYPGGFYPGQAPATKYRNWTFNKWSNPTA